VECFCPFIPLGASVVKKLLKSSEDGLEWFLRGM